MKATDFVIRRLNELIDNFPKLKAKYEYDNSSKSHYIEILPAKEFKNNKDYAIYETKLIIDFISNFPYDEIVFITKNDLIDISNPIFEKEGKLYRVEKVSFWNSFNWSNEIKMNFNLDLNFSFNESIINEINLLTEGFELPELKEIIVKPLIEDPVDIDQDITEYSLAA
ncbi:MAG: hypothetical protein J7K46_07255 [Bacteroidales bacterium]|nr:hypothetical protein [Bacteroidales bacterium]